MMESSNLKIDLLHHHHHPHPHDHHREEEFHGSSSSSSFGGAGPPPFHFMGKESHDQWNQQDSNLLPPSSCGSDFIPNSSTGILTASSRDFVRGSHEMSMGTQDLGFLHWAPSVLNGGEGYMNMMNCNHASPPSPHHQAAAIKEELSSDSMITAKLLLQDYHHHLLPSHDQLMHETNNYQQIHNTFDLLRFAAAGGSVAAVLPTTNIPSSSSLSMDLLDSTRFCRTMLPQPSLNNMVFLREDAAYGGTIVGRQLQQRQPPTETQPVVSSSNHHKVSNSEGKRSNTVDSTTPQSIAKKPRFESRSSCSTPFKVRKEKLGDRIAALQQLVAPFGKTDTASVLMEAIGYIKFLQDQVETLSVPYMRSSNNKTLRSSQGASNEGKGEPKPDLRSRGLCLVPLSCTSYVTNENGGVWSPPNYRGGT